MYLLGLNAYHADSSAAIFRDGILIAATEEERFRRIKHWAGFPSKAVEFCLAEAGIGLGDLDVISIGRDPKAKLLKKALFALRNFSSVSPLLIDRFRNSRQVASVESELTALTGIPASQITSKIFHVEHHDHAKRRERIPFGQACEFSLRLDVHRYLEINRCLEIFDELPDIGRFRNRCCRHVRTPSKTE